jgi:hypothetical protein
MRDAGAAHAASAVVELEDDEDWLRLSPRKVAAETEPFGAVSAEFSLPG